MLKRGVIFSLLSFSSVPPVLLSLKFDLVVLQFLSKQTTSDPEGGGDDGDPQTTAWRRHKHRNSPPFGLSCEGFLLEGCPVIHKPQTSCQWSSTSTFQFTVQVIFIGNISHFSSHCKPSMSHLTLAL